MNHWIWRAVRAVVLGCAVLGHVEVVHAQEAKRAEAVRVRVLSYNIHHGEGVDRKLDLERIAGVVRGVRPDVVALQEVDRGVARTKGVDQPAELAKRVGMEVVFGGNIKLQGGEYGNAVLTRWPVVRKENHLLPRVDNGEQRGVLEVEVAVPGMKGALLLLATHLDHRRDGAERVASAKLINELVAKRAGAAVLAGDMNAVMGSEAIRELQKGWTSVNQEPMGTIPVGRPVRQIDFIFYRPAGEWRVVEVKVLEEAVASDHRAIFAELEWVGEGQGK